jgi:hypothetical protein
MFKLYPEQVSKPQRNGKIAMFVVVAIYIFKYWTWINTLTGKKIDFFMMIRNTSMNSPFGHMLGIALAVYFIVYWLSRFTYRE